MTSGSEVTRDQVQLWLEEYDGQLKPTTELREFLEGKLAEEGVTEPMVDTRYRDGFGDETNVVDLILEDLPSYAS